jgi:hypothetical protein
VCPGCRHTTRHDTTRPVCTGTHTRHVPTRPNEIWGFHGRTTRTKFRGFRVRTTRTKFRGFRGRTTRTKPRGSIRKTGHTNMQRTHERSRLSIFGTPTCARAPHTARHGPTGLVRADPTRPNAFARAPTHDTTRPDPNKIWGFLICTTRMKFGVSMGARPERRHKAASGKRVARTCRRHTGGHDLGRAEQTSCTNVHKANLGAPTHGTARPDPPWASRPESPERNLGFPWVYDLNKEGTWAVMTWHFRHAHVCPRTPTHGMARDDLARLKEIWGLNGRTTRTKARG